MLVDSHCHLTDQQFSGDRLNVLLRAKAAGVEKILSIASDREDSGRVVDLVDRFSGVDGRIAGGEGGGSEVTGGGFADGPLELPALWGTAGIHPHDAKGAREGDLDSIRDTIRTHSRIVAVGETGLDFFYDNSPRGVQETLFRDHLAMAYELGLPVVVHSRNADELTCEILREWGTRVPGVLHCFTGGQKLMETALGAGWMISFTGVVTFKKYDGQELVRRVPGDRLMIETDGPYMAPVPHRGKRNEPAFVARVAQTMAEIRNEDLEEVQGYTSGNATRFFGLVS